MEQTFALLYHMQGVTDAGLQAMPRRERVWLLNRLVKERKKENALMKEAKDK